MAARSRGKTQTIEKSGELSFNRYFTVDGSSPFDEVVWETRDVAITDSKGKVVFSQKAVEVPASWSQSATNIAVSKYFRGQLGTPERETSIKQMISRVSDTIAKWGKAGGYFSSDEEAKVFEDELNYLLVNQLAAFNSPVWFNFGIEKNPQGSACFINSVKDDMRSILNLAVTEGMIFKYGSGTGTNLSVLRSSREYLSFSSGKASGPVSFMKGFDTFAGVIKSGGKTRRAAKMVMLNMDHPDIVDFINCKANEEKKAWALIDAGYDGSMNGEAYASIMFQNANNSVRASDDFMTAVVEDRDWRTRKVTNGDYCDTYKARDIMKMIAEATYICGDPGMQFDSTINKWHTCPNSGKINASNPCSEFMFLDDSACNLSSLNLIKYRAEEGEFDVESFKRAVAIMITAQEIIVGNSSYPTPAIEKNSHDYRPLGLGYANLGALLMSCGLPYDSDQGRNYAAAITSLMTGYAYYVSSLIAKHIGPFKHYKTNEEPMLRVMRMHAEKSKTMAGEGVSRDLLSEARGVWEKVAESGGKFGFRNAQVTVLAPTGTIGFLMDCDTTGIEPDLALVKYKWLVGGGMMKLVNGTVPEALGRLGYKKEQVDDILKYIDANDTIEGAPHLSQEHLAVFDCAFKPAKGSRSIHYMGHLRMMGAVQPFLSGAISKTVNVPNEITSDEIAKIYIEGWHLGLKSIAIYRDGSKRTQPLTTTRGTEEKTVYKPVRQRLPDERRAITHKFVISGHEGYITVGLYEDGRPGEVFITMSKEGTVISGLMDSFSTSISIALQYGVPLDVLAKKFVHVRFEPSGVTNNPNIRFARSIVDYIFKWLALKFLSEEQLSELGMTPVQGQSIKEELPVIQKKLDVPLPTMDKQTFVAQSDAPPCGFCGSIMVRNGACYKCMNCGGTSGCS